jgi:hypothetical protein
MASIIIGSNTLFSFGDVTPLCTEWHNCTEERHTFHRKHILLQSELTR